jgi:dihydroflavonol-4-reductase
MTRALITGCTGCLGSHLARALTEKGIEVVGLSYQNESRIALEGLDVKLIESDVMDLESLRAAMQGIDWVFHAAGIADDWHHKTERVYQTNVKGTQNVLTAAYEAHVKRFILTASAAVTGVPTSTDGSLMNEESTFNMAPRDWIYGHSKLLAEQIMIQFVARGMHAVSVAPTALMGPGDHHFVTGSIIKRAANKELFPFPDGGSNFIDVRDAAMGHITAAERGKPGERYILGAHNMTHVDCASIICEAIGVPLRYVHVSKGIVPLFAESVELLIKMGIRLPIDRGRVYLSRQYMFYDNQKAVKELGLKTRPFSETAADTYNWYLAHNMIKPPRHNRRLPAV